MKKKSLNSSKFTKISKMKTIKIKEQTHQELREYQIKNKLKTLDEAVNRLLKCKN